MSQTRPDQVSPPPFPLLFCATFMCFFLTLTNLLVQNISKWSRTVQTSSGWSKIIKNGQKQLKIVQNSSQWFKVFQQDPKCFKMLQHGPQSKIVKNCPIRSKMFQFGLKLNKGRKFQKWSIMVKQSNIVQNLSQLFKMVKRKLQNTQNASNCSIWSNMVKRCLKQLTNWL